MGPSEHPWPVRVFSAPDVEATRALGGALARAALPLPPKGLLVALTGDLGAGKTVFVQGVARGLDLPPSVSVVSPTFTIARSYPAPGGVTLHHIDAYRLQTAEDLELVGFEDMWGKDCLTCVEWSERVRDALPPDGIRIRIEAVGDAPATPPGAEPRLPRRVGMEAEGPESARVLQRLVTQREDA